jgi:hypothetical protein
MLQPVAFLHTSLLSTTAVVPIYKLANWGWKLCNGFQANNDGEQSVALIPQIFADGFTMLTAADKT